MADFSELKGQINGLITALEEIEREAVTLQDTNRELLDIASSMNSVCVSMAKVIKESEVVYDFVNETSAKETLQSFHNAAERFEYACQNVTKEFANESAALKTQVEYTLYQFKEEMSKKMLILGGSAIVCAIIAIVMAII